MRIKLSILAWGSVMILVVAVGYTVWLWSQLEETSNAHFVSEVLGAEDSEQEELATNRPVANDEDDCLNEEELAERFTSALPMFYFLDGQANVPRMATQQFINCIEFPQCGDSYESITVNEQCVSYHLDSLSIYQEDWQNVSGKLNSGKYLAASVRQQDYKVNKNELVKRVVNELLTKVKLSQLQNKEYEPRNVYIQVPKDVNAPSTDGTLSDRYIEVDGSRQLVWVWRKGKVYRRFRMSGAFPEYNPVGIYAILNKSTNAWSSTALKWMPYWMAFTYNREQETMFGFHSLVYWYPDFEKTGDRSEILEEPESNIGRPRSTGCMRLTKTNAKWLYENTKVGDIVIIHD